MMVVSMLRRDVPQGIPGHGDYRIPVRRVLCLNQYNAVVAQGITFCDGQELFLMMVLSNGVRQWQWNREPPASTIRQETIWEQS